MTPSTTDDDHPRPKLCTTGDIGTSLHFLMEDYPAPESPGSSCYHSAHSTARVTNATISSFGDHDYDDDDDDDADDECSSSCSTVSSLCSCTIGTAVATTKKPHKGNDARWDAIRAFKGLCSSHFKKLGTLGRGSTGSVLFLVELRGTSSLFAVKVKDKERVMMMMMMMTTASGFHDNEKEMLQCFDHPFLPTLYAYFETEKVWSLVLEYCPGGDLGTLRLHQPLNCFSEDAARFYAAEVLLALEYLHLLGIIYRDLRSDNVMIREDGHIMLANFEHSLQCSVCPTLANMDTCSSRDSGYWVRPSCISETTCLQPTCFSPHFLRVGRSKYKSRKANSNAVHSQDTLPELIAEPTAARSMSIVGDPEYLAPEMIKGEGHGSAVDWWKFGVFLYELLYGKTPFEGSEKNATLFNVVAEPLRFPDLPSISPAARDLIRGLLVKEPQQRLGYRQGAVEIKQHPFFDNINWALIRCAPPPEVPSGYQKKKGRADHVPLESNWSLLGIDMKPAGKYLQMDFF